MHSSKEAQASSSQRQPSHVLARTKSPGHTRNRNQPSVSLKKHHNISDSDSDSSQQNKQDRQPTGKTLTRQKQNRKRRGSPGSYPRKQSTEQKGFKQLKMGDFISKKNSHTKQKQTSGSDAESYSEGEAGFVTQKGGKPSQKQKQRSWFTRYSEEDTAEYRNGYPGKKDDPAKTKNFEFYMNLIPSYPDGDYVDEIHRKWYGDYRKLEVHHGYIQWLFPIRDSGMNYHAQELQKHEAQAIIENKEAILRVRRSYEMMLNFYGMRLNAETGEVSRAQHWQPRFQHLNRSYHNYLRITRILKSLGEFGYEKYKPPFMERVISEAFIEKTLTNCRESCELYWVQTIKDDDTRHRLEQHIDEHKHRTTKKQDKYYKAPMKQSEDNADNNMERAQGAEKKIKNENKEKDQSQPENKSLKTTGTEKEIEREDKEKDESQTENKSQKTPWVEEKTGNEGMENEHSQK